MKPLELQVNRSGDLQTLGVFQLPANFPADPAKLDFRPETNRGNDLRR